MAEYENLEEVTATCGDEISDLLQADLRNVDWVNSSELSEETDEIQEEICESVVEEIVVEQENENYLTCVGDPCVEESVVYVFEDFELSDSQYIIQETETYELIEQETEEPDRMNSESSQDADKIDEDNIVGESHVQHSDNEESESGNAVCEDNLEAIVFEETIESADCEKKTSDTSVNNNNSENELTVNNFNEDSNSTDNLNSEFIKNQVETSVQADSSDENEDSVSNVLIGPLPENESYPNPEIGPKFEREDSPPKITSPATPKSLSTPGDTKSPHSDAGSSSALKMLGKDQIKKRLQSFSLLKQGIQALPIKKFNPKLPKVHTKIEEVYDAIGRRTEEKIILKKPPKQGPTPSEKARQVIDEIEQIKKEEAAIYEQTLLFMKNSMLDAHRRKSRSRRARRSKSPRRDKMFAKTSLSPVRKDKKHERYSPDKKDKKSDKERSKKMSEGEKAPKNVESDRCKSPERKKLDKSIEKQQTKEEEMPSTWTEIKKKNIDFQKIKKIKEKTFNFAEASVSSSSKNERGKKDEKDQQQQEINKVFKKKDYIKPQLIFEFPSMLRTSIVASSVDGKSKHYPAELIRFTEKLPSISYCENPKDLTILFRTRKQVLGEVSEDRAHIMKRIMENKNGRVSPGKYVEGKWYSQDNYLEESKAEVEVSTSYGLSVLSEMYDDEQEEIHEPDPEKTTKRHKKKKESKKVKKKHKKNKSKSKSRSPSREHIKKHKNKKEKHSQEHSDKEDKKNDELEFESKQNIETPKKISENSVEGQKDDNTPNTEEYRSNWESDEEFLNDIIPSNKDIQYKHNIWNMEDDFHGKYSEERNFENKNERKNRNPVQDIFEEQNRRKEKYETKRFPYEETHSSVSIRLSEERMPLRHGFEKQYPSESILNDFEYREDRNYSRRSSIKSESRKSFDFNFENDMFDSKQSVNLSLEGRHAEKFESSSIDVNFETISSSSLSKSEDKEKFRYNPEPDYGVSQEFRHDSIERYEHFRKTNESEHYRKISDSSKSEHSNKSRSSLEKDKRFNDFKEDRLRRDSDSRKSVEERRISERSIKEENILPNYNYKKKYEKVQISLDKEFKETRRGSLDRSCNQIYDTKPKFKAESIEKDNHPKKYRTEEPFTKEVKKYDEKSKHSFFDIKRLSEVEKLQESENKREKSYSLDRERKFDSKSNRNSPPELKKLDEIRHQQKNQWSSEEDFGKSSTRKKSYVKYDKPIEEQLNFKLQSSEWSSDEGFDRKKSRKFEIKKNKKSKFSADVETKNYQLLNEDFLSLKDLARQRKLTEEIKEKRKKSKDKEDNYSRKKSKIEKKKAEEKEKQEKNKLKDKKIKFKKDKKPKVRINYSEAEDSYDEDFQTAKQKQQSRDCLVVENTESAKKHAAKIKIDYSDFDLSLSESKHQYNKLEESHVSPPETSKNVESPQISKERKINIDLLEIATDHQETLPKKTEVEPDKADFQDISRTHGSSKPTELINLSPKISKSTTNILNVSGLSQKILHTPKAVDSKHQNESSFTPKLKKKSTDPIIPKSGDNSQTKIEIAGIAPSTPKVDFNKPSPLLITPNVSPIKMISEISPVAPPVLSVSSVPTTPVASDPSKLVSEYEEFMKAVSFDESKEDTVEEKSPVIKEKEKIEDTDKDSSKESEESDSSSENSSAEYDSSEEESDSYSDSNSSSASSETRRNKMLKTVANIKKEKLSDSENESQKLRTEKRKRNDSSTEIKTPTDLHIKVEKELKKRKKSEEVKTFESASKYDNIIDWEKSYCDNTSKQVVDQMSLSILPENIPLPSENIVSKTTLEDDPIPNYSEQVQSPPQTDVISISSDSSVQSPCKKSRAIIPIKFLTAESRKKAIETAKTLESSIFGKFTAQDSEEKAAVESSSDITSINSENLLSTSTETIDDQNTSRKRQSQWNLNITPSKKPLLQTNPLAEPDSDEDFTVKFVKQPDKKEEHPKNEEINKENMKELSSKSELTLHDDKKDDRKLIESKEKSRGGKDIPRDKTRHSPEHRKDEHRRSASPILDKDKRTMRRSSRERVERYDKNDRREKPKDNQENKRDRSRDLSINRDRDKRRQPDRRLSDRKLPTRGRSPRRFSRDRDLQRVRPRERSRERLGRSREHDRERERDRSKERIQERSRERDDRRNYRRYSRSPTPHRKENILAPQRRDEADLKATNVDGTQSPVNSPLDGFKRSLADSTISDSELVTQLNTPDESNEPSPAYTQLHPQHYYPSIRESPLERHLSPASPKRISLDDRINLVLGIEKDTPKQIDTVCTRGSYTSHTSHNNYDSYGYSRLEYDGYNVQTHQPQGYTSNYSTPYQSQYYPKQLNTDNNVKVLQVGNVIQVVPTEEPIAPVPKPVENSPQVVQVGNVLEIVPVSIIDDIPAVPNSPIITVATISSPEKPVVPKATDQLAAERKAEKEKRRLEREARRKEKERKKKEKEKRKQLKIKTKTENMIKRALMLETGDDLDISNLDTAEATESDNNLSASWPPASSLTAVPLPKPPSKGILVTHGFREKDESSLDDTIEIRKVVKFADGVCPGEGTSPSGGEDLPSPPPPPRKLPKEKRYKRIKSNKKKIKVKIIRTQQQTAEDDSPEEDNLPPPPPPPGSPPPHLWPPRIKQPPINNIHPSLPANVFPHPAPTYSAPQQVMYPPAFPPMSPAGQPVPVVIGHAPPPPPPQRPHHPPAMPILQTGPPPPPPHHGVHQPSFHH